MYLIQTFFCEILFLKDRAKASKLAFERPFYAKTKFLCLYDNRVCRKVTAALESISSYLDHLPASVLGSVEHIVAVLHF